MKAKDGTDLPEGLYVVMTAPPGGQSAGDAAAAVIAEFPGWHQEIGGALRARLKDFPQFVELEDHAGRGHGEDVGVTWREREDGRWLLGPFDSPSVEVLARTAVAAVMRDLEGRSGIDHALDDVSPDVREEMNAELRDAVLRAWGADGTRTRLDLAGDLVRGLRVAPEPSQQEQDATDFFLGDGPKGAA